MVLGQANNRMIFGAYCHESELASHPFRAEKKEKAEGENFLPSGEDMHVMSEKEAFDSSGMKLVGGLIGGGALGATLGGIGGALAGSAIGANNGHPVLGTLAGLTVGILGAGSLGAYIGLKAAEN